MIYAVAGSGGKTTLIHQMAQEYLAEGKKVFVTTSTHMLIEPDTLLTDDAEVILQKLEADGYAMAGLPIGEKIGPLSMETYQKVCERADVVLVEADGSRHMPIKFPNETEPVIYPNVDEIVIVCGMQAVGKKAKDVAFRLELVEKCLGITAEDVITAEHIEQLIQKGYLQPLEKAYPDKKLRVCPVLVEWEKEE